MGRDELFRSCGVSAPGVVSKIFLAPLVGIYRRSLPLSFFRKTLEPQRTQRTSGSTRASEARTVLAQPQLLREIFE